MLAGPSGHGVPTVLAPRRSASPAPERGRRADVTRPSGVVAGLTASRPARRSPPYRGRGAAAPVLRRAARGARADPVAVHGQPVPLTDGAGAARPAPGAARADGRRGVGRLPRGWTSCGAARTHRHGGPGPDPVRARQSHGDGLHAERRRSRPHDGAPARPVGGVAGARLLARLLLLGRAARQGECGRSSCGRSVAARMARSSARRAASVGSRPRHRHRGRGGSHRASAAQLPRDGQAPRRRARAAGGLGRSQGGRGASACAAEATQPVGGTPRHAAPSVDSAHVSDGT